ncbi:helix-turn-helix domain-containing protein [Nordella sp. HKS 07]|uniref:winged helix-turn-helix transcriptional regulator n=1 Tax=Nordella sp. HKS 07 TaxID=2712222 RepID=UPI001FEF2C51|nr:helix-turn-helix domain-containing protein [Nordella sp. HKS 07]
MSSMNAAVGGDDCIVVREILSRLGDKWSVRVIHQVAGEPIRFTDLKRRFEQDSPISSRVLTRTLKQLERDGLVSRRVFPVVPPRVEYNLTELGKQFLHYAQEIVDWTIEHQNAFEAARREFEAQSAEQ